MHVRKDDVVRVITGAHKEQEGKVLRVLQKQSRVVVQNVNYVHKHIKRSQKHPQGGRIKKEAPIAASNVALVCPECSAAGRVGNRVDDGKRVRVCKVCNAAILYGQEAAGKKETSGE